MEKIEIRGVVFDSVSMAEATKRCKDWLTEPDRTTPAVIHTPNAEIVSFASSSPKYAGLSTPQTLSCPTAAGVILASKILGKPLKKARSRASSCRNASSSFCVPNWGSVCSYSAAGQAFLEAAADRLREKSIPA